MRLVRPALAAVLALTFLFGADAYARATLVRIPRVVGMRADDASRVLTDARLSIRLHGPHGGEDIRIVTAQQPAAGVGVRSGTEVEVTYSVATFGGAVRP